jgi:hypothetical protein
LSADVIAVWTFFLHFLDVAHDIPIKDELRRKKRRTLCKVLMKPESGKMACNAISAGITAKTKI